MTRRHLTYLAAFVVAGAIPAAAWVSTPTMPTITAVPGQCVQVFGNGFCDGPMQGDGAYRHCENGFGILNCFYVRPVPVAVDPRGWVPA